MAWWLCMGNPIGVLHVDIFKLLHEHILKIWPYNFPEGGINSQGSYFVTLVVKSEVTSNGRKATKMLGVDHTVSQKVVMWSPWVNHVVPYGIYVEWWSTSYLQDWRVFQGGPMVRWHMASSCERGLKWFICARGFIREDQWLGLNERL